MMTSVEINKNVRNYIMPPDKWGIRNGFDRPKQKNDLKGLDSVPNQELVEWSVKLFLLMNLSWGYVDTILNLCAQMKLGEVKHQCREIKEQKRLYYQFRQSFYSDNEEINETERGEWFEDTFSSDFDKLFNGIDNLARVVAGSENHRLVLIAVQQALTLIESVIRYARYCDGEIKKYGVWTTDCCMVQNEFLSMARIVRALPCAKDERFVPLRELSSRILENRLKGMEVWEETTGQIRMRATI